MTIAEDIIETKLRRAKYIAAEAAILDGSQSYSIGNRTITMADLGDIQNMIDSLTGKIKSLERGNTIPVQRVVPRDNV